MTPPPPPPPSSSSQPLQQAGKFKPKKKLGKKIRVGATMGAAAADATTTTTMDNAPLLPASGEVRNRRNHAGRHHGGRGRTGRGREPIPQGQAFFTADISSPTTGGDGGTQSGRDGGGGGGGGIKSGDIDAFHGVGGTNSGGIKIKKETDEEVVGELEESIGMKATAQGSATGSTSVSAAAQTQIPNMAMSMSSGAAGTSSGAATSFLHANKKKTMDNAYMFYDSDSSKEYNDDVDTTTQTDEKKNDSSYQPLSLPFPSTNLHTPMYLTDVAEAAAAAAAAPRSSDTAINFNLHGSVDPTFPSPFANIKNAIDMQAEENSWFLMQLPTRLPEFQKPMVQEENTFASLDTQETASQVVASKVADVAIQPVNTTAFDNTLAHSVPGRLGKIIVYKSGKTVLVLEAAAEDGREAVHLNVVEGLSCGFCQQAIIIDQEQEEYIALGEVKKTIVATPDLSQAFF